MRFTSYAMSVACTLTFVQFALTHSMRALVLPAPVYWHGFVMATVSTVLPAWLMSEGLRRIGANQAALVGSIGPVVTIVLGYLFPERADERAADLRRRAGAGGCDAGDDEEIRRRADRITPFSRREKGWG
jgi:EamA domain-containing membrane protein RarD